MAAKGPEAMKDAAMRALSMLGDMRIEDIKAVTIHTQPPADAPVEEEVEVEEEEVVEESAPGRPRPEDLFEEEEEEEED